jgi:hypothetical protein
MARQTSNARHGQSVAPRRRRGIGEAPAPRSVVIRSCSTAQSRCLALTLCAVATPRWNELLVGAADVVAATRSSDTVMRGLAGRATAQTCRALASGAASAERRLREEVRRAGSAHADAPKRPFEAFGLRQMDIHVPRGAPRMSRAVAAVRLACQESSAPGAPDALPAPEPDRRQPA